jgi:molecular chaperone GrpE (heat shock protein)
MNNYPPFSTPSENPDAPANQPQELPASTPEPAPGTPATGESDGNDEPVGASDETAEEGDVELTDWKNAVRHDFEAWLDSVDEIPLLDEALEPVDTPDLYSFFEQLAAANAESRKGNRRTAEAFSQWGDTLARFDEDLRLLRNQLEHQASSQTRENALSRAHALVLVELLDRLQRLDRAFQAPPRKSWWGNDKLWRQTWETQRQAFDILLSHFASWLAQEGIVRIVVLDQPFNPAIMTAVATAPDAQRPHHTVIEEVSAGYRHHGELLRPAQVKVTLNRTHSTVS